MKILNLLKRSYRILIPMTVLVALICLNLVLSIRDLPRIVPLTTTRDQLFYEQSEDGVLYPGALLALMVENRKIYVKDDITHYTFDMSDPVAPWENCLNDIYYGMNSKNLLSALGAEVISDDSLNDALITEEMKERFTDLGLSNDLYRFSFAANDIQEEYGNYFHYYFYYTAHGAPMHVYFLADDPAAFTKASDETLVALWQRGERDEDLYLMTKAFYEEEVAP